MGSTAFGDVNPALTGTAEPATFRIDRARFSRVRIGGPA